MGDICKPLLVWVVKRPFVTESTEQDIRFKLCYNSERVPTRFDLIDMKKDRNLMMEGLAWLMSQDQIN
jgi:hypothetical protein